MNTYKTWKKSATGSISASLNFFLHIYLYTLKNVKNDGDQEEHLPFRRIFSLILGWFWQFYVVFCYFVSFSFNDGNQLPGSRLFSRYDTYIHIYMLHKYIYKSMVYLWP